MKATRLTGVAAILLSGGIFVACSSAAHHYAILNAASGA